MKIIGASARTSFYYKKDSKQFPNWRLIYKSHCKSTEYELSKYLSSNAIKQNMPIAIISKEQIAGIGQHGRKWISPRGGIWLSAAYPVFSNKFKSEIFPLSIAQGLCEMFYEESIEVTLKWPNDILYGTQKLIGFLPKLVSRGNEILYTRIGIGMNLNNKTPLEGISLAQILNKKSLCEHYWTSKILKSICNSIKSNHNKEHIIKESNKFLNRKCLPKGYELGDWKIKNIDLDGKLILINNHKEKKIKI